MRNTRHKIVLLSDGKQIEAKAGANLLETLRSEGLAPEAPCGGRGTCGKCQVTIDGQLALACQTSIDRDMTVLLPRSLQTKILTGGVENAVSLLPVRPGNLLAYDIGTTTVVCYLVDGMTGKELASASMLNPQSPYGADVLTRIQHALDGQLDDLTTRIRTGMQYLAENVCASVGIEPSQIGVVSIVGNPAMQQLFLGISPSNLAEVPFAPVLTAAQIVEVSDYLPICSNAVLLIVPNISGYIGADTIGCLLSTRMYLEEEITLLVDIGTNGEMVLGNKEHMIACSTAAGPALEGANICCGMRGAPGAIDHVWLDGEKLCFHVIGGGEAIGICGSGLIDAVAVLLESGVLNQRGRIQLDVPIFADRLVEVDGQRIFRLSERVYLTQEDIREVQLAKGAIAAGIQLMAKHFDIPLERISRVLLAGAFGSFMNPESACKIGLLPNVLRKKITAVGNVAGSGAKMLACNQELFALTQQLAKEITFLELAKLEDFRICFAKNMNM